MVVLRNDRISSTPADGESGNVGVSGVPLRSATTGHMSRDNQVTSKSYTSLNHRAENSDGNDKPPGDPSENENTSLTRHRRRRSSATRSNVDLVQQMLFSNQLGKVNVGEEASQTTTMDRRRDRRKQTAVTPIVVDTNRRVSSDDEDADSDASGGTFVIGESDDEDRAAQLRHEDGKKRLPDCFAASSDRKHERKRNRKTWKESDGGERMTSAVHGAVNNDDLSVDSRANGMKRLEFVEDTLSGASQRNESMVGKMTTRPDTIGNKITKLLFDTPTGTTSGGESPNNKGETTVESRLPDNVSQTKTSPDLNRQSKACLGSESTVVESKSMTSGADESEKRKQATAFTAVRPTVRGEETQQVSV